MLLSLTIELSILSSILVLQSVDRNIGNVIKPGRNQPEMDPQLITRLTTSFLHCKSVLCSTFFLLCCNKSLSALALVSWDRVMADLPACQCKEILGETNSDAMNSPDGWEYTTVFEAWSWHLSLIVQRIWYIGWIEYRFSSSEDRLDVLNGIAP